MADNSTQVPSIVKTGASTLMQMTGDAMDNIFDVGIKFPWDSDVDSKLETTYRVSGFSIPETKVDTYEVTWHGISVKKVKAGVNLTREFTLEFRMDATYALYNRFKKWQSAVVDVNTGGVANTAAALGTVWVWAPGSEYTASSHFTVDNPNGKDGEFLKDTLNGKVNNLYWVFEDCQVIEVGEPKFNNKKAGDNLKYSVKFIFGDMYCPFNAHK